MNNSANCAFDSFIQQLPSHKVTAESLRLFDSSMSITHFKNPDEIVLIKWNCDGFWHFSIWNLKEQQTELLFKDCIPIIEYINDTIIKANPDLNEDLLIQGKYANGKYQNYYAVLYCYSNSNHFVKIEQMGNIPNPEILNGVVQGKEDTDSLTLNYFYNWVDRFNLSIDSSKSTSTKRILF